METKIPTHDEIRATFAEVRDQIERSHLCLDATIDDYPIGRRERGKCRLQVERAPNKGYRTVRTTTNKYGRWCAAKKSTYSNSLIVVVRDWDTEHQHAWLSCGNPRASVRRCPRQRPVRQRRRHRPGQVLAKRCPTPRGRPLHVGHPHIESRHHRGRLAAREHDRGATGARAHG